MAIECCRAGQGHGRADVDDLHGALGRSLDRCDLDVVGPSPKIASIRLRPGVAGVGASSSLPLWDADRAVAGHHVALVPLGLGVAAALGGEHAAVGGDVQRPAVGEDLLELRGRHPRPGANGAGIEVDEGAARGRIVADAADLVLHRGFAQQLERDAGNVEVHRLAVHVLRILGDAGGFGAQHAVGFGRAVGRDDVDRLAGVDLLVDQPEEVEEGRIHLRLLLVPPVGEEAVELAQGALIVAAVALEGEAGGFAGMGVVEIERPGVTRQRSPRRCSAAEEASVKPARRGLTRAKPRPCKSTIPDR